MSNDKLNPSHYHTDSGMEAVDVMEEFFVQDAHLAQAFKYMARAGKKPESSYTQDVGKAAWWLVRACITYGGTQHIQGVIDLLRRKRVLRDDPS